MRRASALVALLSLPGCALLGEEGSPVRLVSDPPGASAVTSAGPRCVTPCTVRISRLDNFTVTFSKDGYEPREVRVFSVEEAPRPEGGIRTTIGGVGVRVGVVDAAPAPLGPSVGRRVHTPNPVSVALVPAGPR